MKTKNLFEQNLNLSKISSYINYYFLNILKYNKSIFYEQCDLIDEVKTFVSIAKDDIGRLNKDNGGSGVLRIKPYSIFLFTFISRDEYIKIFGTNNNYSKIINIDNKCENFEVESFKVNIKGNGELFRGKSINLLIQNFLKNKIKQKFKSILVNSYVYSCYVIYDNKMNISDNVF